MYKVSVTDPNDLDEVQQNLCFRILDEAAKFAARQGETPTAVEVSSRTLSIHHMTYCKTLNNMQIIVNDALEGESLAFLLPGRGYPQQQKRAEQTNQWRYRWTSSSTTTR